jgi:N4-gp56 family major capsid protein
MREKRMIDLQRFAADTNVMGTEGTVNAVSGNTVAYTVGMGLSEEMKTYYSDYLIDNAEPALVHDMFAQKHQIPQGGGKTVQFRRYNPLPKLTEPIKEGVTPAGQSISMEVLEATVAQYGGYVELTDLLILTAIDNNLCMATKLLGSQAGRTLDTITREVLAGGTNVQYGENAVAARYLLTGGQQSGNHYLSVDAIRRAVRFLKNQNAEKIKGSYIAIVHPDCAYDLMSDPNWKTPNQYADPSNIMEGEIGKIEGVRFIESSEAKVFHADDLADNARNLSVNKSGGYSGTNVIAFDGGNVQAGALVGRYVLIGGTRAYVGANTASEMTLYTDSTKSMIASVSCEDNAVIYPGEAGAMGRDVYATMVFGENAYGTTEITGGGLELIVKQLGSAGTCDPLNQRATVGWKATKVTVRLVEAFMVRIETASTFDDNE